MPSDQVAVLVPPGDGSGIGGQGTGGGSSSGMPFGGGHSGGGNAALFGNSSSALALLARLAPTMVVTTGTVALSMAFLAFGRRRRDESPTAPDSVLAASAAAGMPRAANAGLVPAAVLVANAQAVATAVRAAAAAPVTAGPADEDIPRWRRQSLLEARKTDPTRAVRTSISLAFTGQAGEAVSGLERRRVRYRLVSLLDQPDDVRGAEIGSLDEGDEVVLIERLGTYWRVLCPDGREGWVHKMVLAAPVHDESLPAVPAEAAPPQAAPMGLMSAPPGAPAPAAAHANAGASWTAADEGPAPGSFEDVLRMYSERRAQFGDA